MSISLAIMITYLLLNCNFFINKIQHKIIIISFNVLVAILSIAITYLMYFYNYGKIAVISYAALFILDLLVVTYLNHKMYYPVLPIILSVILGASIAGAVYFGSSHSNQIAAIQAEDARLYRINHENKNNDNIPSSNSSSNSKKTSKSNDVSLPQSDTKHQNIKSKYDHLKDLSKKLYNGNNITQQRNLALAQKDIGKSLSDTDNMTSITNDHQDSKNMYKIYLFLLSSSPYTKDAIANTKSTMSNYKNVVVKHIYPVDSDSSQIKPLYQNNQDNEKIAYAKNGVAIQLIQQLGITRVPALVVVDKQNKVTMTYVGDFDQNILNNVINIGINKYSDND